MYSIYALTSIGMLLGIHSYFKGSKRSIGDFLYKFCSTTFCCGFCGFFLAISICIAVPRVEVKSDPITLVSLRNQDGVSGSFIFGSGSINTSYNYSFLMKQKDGSMVPGSVSSLELVHFIEDPALKNIGYWQTTFFVSDSSHWLYNWSILHSDRTRVIRQEFRVPVGSVIQQFNIK